MSGDIHLYSPDAWHDDAYVVGTREGLQNLAGAIKAAIENGQSVVTAFTGDGEGYSLRVVQVTEEEMPLLELPYVGELARDCRKAIHPCTLVDRK